MSRRFLLLAITAIGVTTFHEHIITAQTSNTAQVHATTPAALREWDAYVGRGERDGQLLLERVDRDPLLPTRTVERFHQFHKDIRVWGADIVRDSENGVPISILGTIATNLPAFVEPSFSVSAARDYFLQIGGNESIVLTSPELVIVQLDNGEYRLAFGAVVAAHDDVARTFIDAHTGEEVLRYTEIQRQQAAVGVGTGVLGDKKKLSVQSNAGIYVAFDRHRPPIIETFDMRGNLTRTKLLERGLLPYTATDLASDSDNVWSDVSVVDAHVHVSWTYDYYFKRFGRSGLDGRNSPIDIVVNAVSQQGALSVSSADIDDYVIGANWCGACGPNGHGRIFFGNGIPPGTVDRPTGRNYTYFSGALDIAAHEMTHAVTEATSGLIYRNESGALNEAFSDMMGKSVEFFFHAVGGGVGQANYVLGKDISRAAVRGALDGDRSMENPGLYGDPDHYSRRYVGSDDNGGVHWNSGIANQAFYLAIEGGTNRTSRLAVQGVGATNRDQIEKIFYRAFTLLMPANATFAMARAATVQAARDLYGPGSAPERAVTQAWTAVGVF